MNIWTCRHNYNRNQIIWMNYFNRLYLYSILLVPSGGIRLWHLQKFLMAIYVKHDGTSSPHIRARQPDKTTDVLLNTRHTDGSPDVLKTLQIYRQLSHTDSPLEKSFTFWGYWWLCKLPDSPPNVLTFPEVLKWPLPKERHLCLYLACEKVSIPEPYT